MTSRSTLRTAIKAWRPAKATEAQGVCARTAFTLIEVLVVIAIIALLVAVLLTSLDKAREQSRRVLCQAHLSELAKAWHMYLRDSGDRFTPRGINQEYNYGGQQGEGAPEFGSDPAVPIAKPLNNPYFRLNAVTRKGAEIFQCPADTGSNWIRPTAFTYYGTSYRMNHLLVGQAAVPALLGDPCRNLWKEVNRRLPKPTAPNLPPPSLTASNLASPSLLLLMGDYSWYECWDRTGVDDWPFWHGRKPYHNLAYFDGHVDFVRMRKGIQVDNRYRLIPFSDLITSASSCQVELPCP